jgi:hypothetical protein
VVTEVEPKSSDGYSITLSTLPSQPHMDYVSLKQTQLKTLSKKIPYHRGKKALHKYIPYFHFLQAHNSILVKEVCRHSLPFSIIFLVLPLSFYLELKRIKT